jgi:4-hydroxy-tetrahydrodipicolinate synthase
MAVFEGILSALPTPFAADGSLDEARIGPLVERTLAAGVQGLIAGGTTGEYYAQTTPERATVLRSVAELGRGRAQLIAGINSARPAETRELAALARELGYDAVLLAAPYYSLPTAGDLAAHVASIAREVELPVMLYNFPARTGVDMDLEFLAAIAGVANVVAIKESSGSFARMLNHVVRFGERYERVCGADDQALDYFLWDARAWVAGLSAALPAEHVALYEACVVRRDFAEGRRIMDRLLPLFLFAEGSGKYNQVAKFGCELAGVPVGDVRAPLQPLSDDERAACRALFVGYGPA